MTSWHSYSNSGLQPALSRSVCTHGSAGSHSSSRPCVYAPMKKHVAFSGDGIPLPQRGTVDPTVGLRIEAEKVHGEGGASADRVVRSRCHAHDVGAFAGVVERDFAGLAGTGVFNGKGTLDQAASDHSFAVGKIGVEQTLAACNDRFFTSVLNPADIRTGTAVKFHPPILGTTAGMPVDPPVQVTVHGCVGPGFVRVLQEAVSALPVFRIK